MAALTSVSDAAEFNGDETQVAHAPVVRVTARSLLESLSWERARRAVPACSVLRVPFLMVTEHQPQDPPTQTVQLAF